MCLALPVRLRAVEAGMAQADLGATSMRLSLALTPDAGPGDWVLVHAGFAIQKLSEADAMETWDALEHCAVGLPPRPGSVSHGPANRVPTAPPSSPAASRPASPEPEPSP